ncbi:MAG: hypothetical protein M3Z85_05660 [Acidobacteriota bacterium]|nr:hypothetical protein [Acidobacteriota bacterium]
MDDIIKRELPSEENPRVAAEHGDADVFAITKYGIGLAISVLIVAMAMWGLFDLFYERETATNAESPVARRVLDERPKIPPEPRLQATPRIELKELRENEAAILGGYGWIDPEKGIVRIPIDRAMDAVLKNGLPTKVTTEGRRAAIR